MLKQLPTSMWEVVATTNLAGSVFRTESIAPFAISIPPMQVFTFDQLAT